MATRFEVIITESAWAEFDEIITYIIGISKSDRSAEKWAKKILKKIFSLEIFPDGGAEFSFNKKYRTAKIGKFLVIYRVDKTKRKVFVQHIVYARRKLDDIL